MDQYCWTRKEHKLILSDGTRVFTGVSAKHSTRSLSDKSSRLIPIQWFSQDYYNLVCYSIQVGWALEWVSTGIQMKRKTTTCTNKMSPYNEYHTHTHTHKSFKGDVSSFSICINFNVFTSNHKQKRLYYLFYFTHQTTTKKNFWWTTTINSELTKKKTKL